MMPSATVLTRTPVLPSCVGQQRGAAGKCSVPPNPSMVTTDHQHIEATSEVCSASIPEVSPSHCINQTY